MLVKYATQGQGDPSIQPPKNCLEKANYYKVYIVKMRKREDPTQQEPHFHHLSSLFIQNVENSDAVGNPLIVSRQNSVKVSWSK